jgi:hypothetical protein
LRSLALRAGVLEGTYQHQLAAVGNKLFIANFLLNIIPVAIIANWFYYKNDRSIALAVLVHSMLNGASVLINAGQAAKVIATGLYAAIAPALIIGDSRLFAEGPHNFLEASRCRNLAASRLTRNRVLD